MPEVRKSLRVTDYRHISLCNVTMKIITKVLANILKDYRPLFVSERQSDFVKGRLISDNILIAREMMHYIEKQSKRSQALLAIKVDMCKSCDRVKWQFMRHILMKMGVERNWVERVMT